MSKSLKAKAVPTAMQKMLKFLLGKVQKMLFSIAVGPAFAFSDFDMVRIRNANSAKFIIT